MEKRKIYKQYFSKINMRKIYFLESQKKDFDKTPFKELKEMIGFTDFDSENKKWDVTLINGFFECETQEHAEMMASLEELKAVYLLNKK